MYVFVGLIIEWVNILGYGELQASDFDVGDEDNDNVSLDTVWTKSKHHVFKRISGSSFMTNDRQFRETVKGFFEDIRHLDKASQLLFNPLDEELRDTLVL